MPLVHVSGIQVVSVQCCSGPRISPLAAIHRRNECCTEFSVSPRPGPRVPASNRLPWAAPPMSHLPRRLVQTCRWLSWRTTLCLRTRMRMSALAPATTTTAVHPGRMWATSSLTSRPLVCLPPPAAPPTFDLAKDRASTLMRSGHEYMLSPTTVLR